MTGRFRGMMTALVLGVLLTGCTGGASVDGMNMQEAASRADEIMDATVNDIKPQVEWVYGPTTKGSCSVTRRRAVMTIVSRVRRGNFLGVVERMWGSRDYRIKSVNNDMDFPAIFAQTRDGFGVALIVGGEGQVFFEVDSPCVEESEVVGPVAEPGRQLPVGTEIIPRPNIHSDFWSGAGGGGGS
ncbi:hypothetical protein ACFVWY_30090 [Streptomyces sp. NPDC058195]|uniref:hypothetical protein n=1 Tax=Streptomyces sp. NPDC058195 TaxID=3346375 RepID=UPI0036EFE404